MKKYLIFFVALCTLLSCTKTELETENEVSGTKFYYAEVPYEDSKTYIDTDYEIHWIADDRISVFCSPANEQYRFTGATGDWKGTFENLTEPAIPTYSRNYAVYPYQSGNTSASEGTMTVSFPSEQSYAENSFGQSANTMVAVTESLADDNFKFRNCCGYLMLKLYGGDKIKSITLRGNNGEKIAGPSTITATYGESPTIAMGDDATTEITLICPAEGVPTNESEESFTQFWIALPPTTFSNGFTIDVTNTADDIISRSTSNSITINRNKILKMASVKVDVQAAHELLSFSLSDGVNTYKAFDISDGYVNVQVPNGTDMTAMTATFEHNGASITVNDVPQTSGVGTHDFSDFVNPLTYVVTSRIGGAQSYIIRMFDLPVLIVNTEDQKDITDKVNYKSCEINLVDKEKDIDYSFVDLEANIKGRGNSTWGYPKKPYNIKLSRKINVFGMPKHKKWCLLANYCDRTLMRNELCQQIGRLSSGLDWVVSGRFIDLIVNGTHRGTYYLCEKVEVEENRVNIGPNGYLLEYDTIEDDYRFKSPLVSEAVYDYIIGKRPVYVKIKAPVEEAAEDPGQVVFNEVKNYILSIEDIIAGKVPGTFYDYFDIPSSVDYYLVHELSGNHDVLLNSNYMHKNSGGLLCAGPLWDFDLYTFSSNWTEHRASHALYYSYFLQDNKYKKAVKERWHDLSIAMDDFDIPAFINLTYGRIRNSALRDKKIWPNSGAETNGDKNLSFEAAKEKLIQM